MNVPNSARFNPGLQKAQVPLTSVRDAVDHELRTPMTLILGNASVLATRRASLTDDQCTEAVQDIELELGRLNSVMNDLVTLARFDRGLRLDTTPLLLGELVEQTALDFAHSHNGIVTVRRGTEAVIRGNEECLTEALNNLLTNASKYSPKRAPIEVEVDERAGECRVAVLDRGIGIPPDEPEQLFVAFYRAERVRTAVRGLGLGLTVCKLVVEAHDGRVWATPRDGGGSEFGFALPDST